MDAIIHGAFLLRTVPVMADAAATSSRFRQEPIMLSPARKTGAPNQTAQWRGQKQGGVCCAEEMGEEIITPKRHNHPSIPQLPTVHHRSQSAIILPDILSCFPRSISACRTSEQERGSRNNVGDALRTVMPERPTARSVGAFLASRHHTHESVKANIDWFKPESNNRLPALHVVSPLQINKRKLVYKWDLKRHWDDPHVNQQLLLSNCIVKLKSTSWYSLMW